MKCILTLTLALLVTQSAFANPTVLFLGVNQTSISTFGYDDNILTFSLVATDNGGVDSLAGAVLLDPILGLPYGTFKTGAQKSALEFTMSTQELFKISGYDPFFEKQKDFDVVVYNGNGASTTARISIELIWKPGFDLTQFKKVNVTGDLSAGSTREIDRLVGKKRVRGHLSIVDEPYIEISPKFQSGRPVPPLNVKDECATAHQVESVLHTDIADCEKTYNQISQLCAAAGSQMKHEDWGDDSFYKRTYSCDSKIKVAIFRSEDRSLQEVFCQSVTRAHSFGCEFFWHNPRNSKPKTFELDIGGSLAFF